VKKSLENLKVALVHDWLMGMRGGEKVLETFCRLFPQSDIYTLLYESDSLSPEIKKHRIFASFVNKLPFKNQKYRNYLPLFPTAIELFNLKGYDLIISSSHCVAKGIIPPPDALHISYIHTPMRYVWDMYDEYFGKGQIGFVKRLIIPAFANYLRMWDVTSSKRVDYFIANSNHVSMRLNKYYRRESMVIYPPVDTDYYKPADKSGEYFLIVSALVPYKKVDLAIKVFNKMQEPLLIIGDGPEEKRLKAMAKSNISFKKWQIPSALLQYYQDCRALLFPGEEDFGIVPVEAQACGKPVIAYNRGGLTETVIGYNGGNERKCTGIFFEEQNETALMNILEKFYSIQWDSSYIRNHAQRFSIDRFRNEIITELRKIVSVHKRDTSGIS
jgi:glycosyltransferase involved in cell wall biosynthesis